VFPKLKAFAGDCALRPVDGRQHVPRSQTRRLGWPAGNDFANPKSASGNLYRHARTIVASRILDDIRALLEIDGLP
jgi:hypothetical protein